MFYCIKMGFCAQKAQWTALFEGGGTFSQTKAVSAFLLPNCWFYCQNLAAFDNQN